MSIIGFEVLERFARFQDSANATGGMDQLEPPSHFAAALVGAFLLALTIAVAPIAWRIVALVAGVDRADSERRPGAVGWGFAHVAIAVFVVGALLFLSGMLSSTAKNDTGLGITLARTAFALGGAGVAIAVFARRLGPQSWRSLGLAGKGSVRGALGGWVAYAAMAPGIIGLALVWRWVLERFGLEFETQMVVKKFLELPDRELPLVLILGVVVMPFLEELFFRAFLQSLLVQRTGAKTGIVITSVLFGALHGTSAFLPIFGLSLVLGAVMQRTQRLFAAWAVHALHNGLMFGALTILHHHPELLGKSAVLALS